MFLIIALHIAILISNIWLSYFLLKINNANDLLYINSDEKYLYMTVENQVQFCKEANINAEGIKVLMGLVANKWLL